MNPQAECDLLQLMEIDLVRAGGDQPAIWRGSTVLGGDGSAFGGQMAAQALMVAKAMQPDRAPESVHTHFLSSARPDTPIDHEVKILRSGRAFTVLRVESRQGERHCLSSTITLHNSEGSPEHQMPMPALEIPEAYPLSDFVPPGTCPSVRQCFEIREVSAQSKAEAGCYPQQAYWFRYKGDLGKDQAVHNAALVWFSDLSMPWTTDLAYDERHGRRVGASLDHTVWFHRPARADEWLYFAQESIVYAGARALMRGVFFTEDGSLIASAAQETLLRRLF
ncbi:MAG: acyl-CoA thioesterase [Syntrophotalea sp.]|uniref:acyl-CoA thioesterase n=1 Tax=Syntrophotalea sp. TaxID=2812029 RepID=UPI003D0DC94A